MLCVFVGFVGLMGLFCCCRWFVILDCFGLFDSWGFVGWLGLPWIFTLLALFDYVGSLYLNGLHGMTGFYDLFALFISCLNVLFSLRDSLLG